METRAGWPLTATLPSGGMCAAGNQRVSTMFFSLAMRRMLIMA